MEPPDPLDPLGPRREERGPEVVFPLLLAEAAAGDEADARGVEEAEAVELVRGAVFLFGLGGGAGGQGDGWVEVHGALEGGLVVSEGPVREGDREGWIMGREANR